MTDVQSFYGVGNREETEEKEKDMMIDEERKTDLNPCPFCLEHRLTFRTNKFGANYVYCTWCGARGPEKSNETRAAEAWNNRGMQR